MTVPAIATAIRAISHLFGPGVDKRIKADLDPAIERGDVQYLLNWISDYPPHPRDSIAYAQAHLGVAQQIAAQRNAVALQTGQPVYGGRLSAPQLTPPTPYSAPVAPSFEPTGLIPVNTRVGPIGIPYVAANPYG